MEYPSLDKPTAGAFRFNTDSSQLEIYDGNQWTGVLATSPEQQTGGTRGLTMGGYTSPTFTNVIEYINIATTGNAADFGDLNALLQDPMAVASRTRGISGGGLSYPGPAYVNTVQAVTISSTGNSVDFGDLTAARNTISGGGNSTRGIYCGGNPNSKTNIIDFVEISTTGNASDFGDLTVEKRNAGKGQASNATRHIVYGGQITPSVTNSIEFVTIATLGNGIDFGDASTPIESSMAMASPTRAVFAGGNENDDTTHTRIDSMEFTTRGEVTSFGTLAPSAASGGVGISNGHGGL